MCDASETTLNNQYNKFSLVQPSYDVFFEWIMLLCLHENKRSYISVKLEEDQIARSIEIDCLVLIKTCKMKYHDVVFRPASVFSSLLQHLFWLAFDNKSANHINTSSGPSTWQQSTCHTYLVSNLRHWNGKEALLQCYAYELLCLHENSQSNVHRRLLRQTVGPSAPQYHTNSSSYILYHRNLQFFGELSS